MMDTRLSAHVTCSTNIWNAIEKLGYLSKARISQRKRKGSTTISSASEQVGGMRSAYETREKRQRDPRAHAAVWPIGRYDHQLTPKGRERVIRGRCRAQEGIRDPAYKPYRLKRLVRGRGVRRAIIWHLHQRSGDLGGKSGPFVRGGLRCKRGSPGTVELSSGLEV